jgi:hypothetical protein
MLERRKRVCISGLWGALLFGSLQILASNCQAYPGSGPSPEPAPPASEPASPASAVSISFYEFQPVGEYRLIQIGPAGEAQSVLFQRTVSQLREGQADTVLLQELRALVESEELGKLAPRYDPPPSEPGKPAVIYEDTYYRLTVTRAGGSREVLAHEHAAPPLVKEIVTRLIALGRKLPEQPRSGLFLVAFEPAMADQIRWLRGKKAEAPSGEAAPSRHPLVAKALSQPGWLFPVPSSEAPAIPGIFPGESRRLDLGDGERKLAVCLLSGTENP